MRTSMTIRTSKASLYNTALSGSGGCYINLYDGTRPAGPDTALGAGNHLLATCRGSTTFGTVTNGVLTAGTISDGTGTAAASTGVVPTFARLLATDNSTAVCDLSVSVNGANNAEVNLAAASVVQNATLSVSSCVITEPLGT